MNSMVPDAFRWLVEGFKTVSGGVLGVDDEEKTVYIYIYIYIYKRVSCSSLGVDK